MNSVSSSKANFTTRTAKSEDAEVRIKNPDSECLVLVDTITHKVIGFADVGPCREKNVDSDGELYAIYLFQEFQNLGGGKIL